VLLQVRRFVFESPQLRFGEDRLIGALRTEALELIKHPAPSSSSWSWLWSPRACCPEAVADPTRKAL